MAKELYDAVVARYSSPSTTTLGRIMLPYLLSELLDFPAIADLMTHLCSSDVRYRAALKSAFLASNPPPMDKAVGVQRCTRQRTASPAGPVVEAAPTLSRTRDPATRALGRIRGRLMHQTGPPGIRHGFV
ncbi:unnamed protein product [Closterium sp. NIES-54]